MSSIGIFSVLSTVSTQMAPTESFANLAMVKSPRSIIRRYLYGLHEKTKRTLAEEAECGDEVATTTWIKDGKILKLKLIFNYEILIIIFAVLKVATQMRLMPMAIHHC